MQSNYSKTDLSQRDSLTKWKSGVAWVGNLITLRLLYLGKYSLSATEMIKISISRNSRLNFVSKDQVFIFQNQKTSLKILLEERQKKIQKTAKRLKH